MHLPGAEEAEVLVEDGVPGGEFGGPGQRDLLVLLLPREIVEHKADQEADAFDLDGEGAEELRWGPLRGRRRLGLRLRGGISRGGLGRRAGVVGGDRFRHGDALELVLVPEIERRGRLRRRGRGGVRVRRRSRRHGRRRRGGGEGDGRWGREVDAVEPLLVIVSIEAAGRGGEVVEVEALEVGGEGEGEVDGEEQQDEEGGPRRPEPDPARRRHG